MHDLSDQLETLTPTALTGSVVRTEGVTVAIRDFPAPVGSLVEIERHTGGIVRGETIGFRDPLTLVYPFGQILGVRRGSRARLVRSSSHLRVGPSLLGRVVNAHGRCIDGNPPPMLSERIRRLGKPPRAIGRSPSRFRRGCVPSTASSPAESVNAWASSQELASARASFWE